MDRIIAKFITAKRSDGRRPRTISDYRRVLARYSEHVIGDIPSWTRDTIRDYVSGLYEQPWAPATIAQHVRYIRAFLRWLHHEGYTVSDLSLAVSAPALSIREETLLTIEEFTALITACAGDRWAIRDKAIILMLVDTGLRRGEFASLRRDQVTFENGAGWLQLPGRVAKNGHDRFVFMGRACAAALRAYLETRNDDDPALIVSERGPLGGDGLYHMLRRRAKQAGLDALRVHPHLLRKMFASWWIEAGGDEQRLMAIAGWSGPEMLRIYVRLGSRQKLQEAHQKFGPVDRLFLLEEP